MSKEQCIVCDLVGRLSLGALLALGIWQLHFDNSCFISWMVHVLLIYMHVPNDLTFSC